MDRIGGIVLCGGHSKRMGQSKAWLPFGKERMLQRVVRILGAVVRPVVVVAATDQDLPGLPADVSVVRDATPDRGPLGGLATGLVTLNGACDAAYLSSCDVPFLQSQFVTRMGEFLGEHSVCVPRVDNMYHPLAAVYRVDVCEVVERLLAANRLRPIFLFDEVPTRIILADELVAVDPTLQTLRNLNAPADYEAALRDAGFIPAETGDPDHGA
jgi:molybdenum cofactor guanylyltransferase